MSASGSEWKNERVCANECVVVRCCVLQCAAVRCGVLWCVAVCCSVLQCLKGAQEAASGRLTVCLWEGKKDGCVRGKGHEYGTMILCCRVVWCSMLQWDAVCCSVLQWGAVCCSVLQCVAVNCSASQCVTVCCSALQCVKRVLQVDRQKDR